MQMAFEAGRLIGKADTEEYSFRPQERKDEIMKCSKRQLDDAQNLLIKYLEKSK